MKALDYIDQRKKEIFKMLEIDHSLGADPYDNVARLKELEKIEKVLRKEFEKEEVIKMEFCPECCSQILHVEGCNLCPCCGYSSCNCGICNGKEEFSDVQSKDRASSSEKIVPA